MNKTRLEALSDGVFAIVMTLLIFDIKVPTSTGEVTNIELWDQLAVLLPHILVYAGTFTVLSTMWINHHFLFQRFAKNIDRKLNLINLVYLMFVAFVPFSASFLGTYYQYQPAVILYGLNLLAITFITIFMVNHIVRTQGNEHLSMRLLNQSRFRAFVNISCYTLAMIASLMHVYISMFLIIFPVIFNIVPGTLDFTEKMLGFDLDKGWR